MTRPAASGGAADGERERVATTLQQGILDRQEALDVADDLIAMPQLLAERARLLAGHAPVASQADGELREALRRLIETAPVMQHSNGYPVRAVPIAELLMVLDRRVL